MAAAMTHDPTKTEEHIVLFVDMLGFSALTEEYPQSLITEIHTQLHTTVTFTSPAASQFARFHSILDWFIARRTIDGSLKAMTFSDCAFLVLGPALLTALCASELMRRFIQAGIPTRMGIASGSFDALRFSSDTQGKTNVTRAIFAGTGIVRAHDVERRGGRGLRIFLHRSLADCIPSIHQRLRVLDFAVPAGPAAAELSYLFESESSLEPKPGVLATDRNLWDAIMRMRTALPVDTHGDVLDQYDQTLLAINRMRKDVHRQEFAAT
jgi:hypothetical protein